MPRSSTSYLLLKRGLDLVVASAALLLLSPLLILIALANLILMGRPILFTQVRVGYRERVFRLLKFRTMTDARDEQGRELADAARLTRTGRLLRAASLDELPTLFNVLRGHLSLVGPRPLLVRYLDRYTPEQRRRHEVPPGITGWAQIHGRNALSWEEKFRYDTWYVDHCSFLLDLKILVLTPLSVLRREGIQHPGDATMPEFLPDRSPPADPSARAEDSERSRD